MSSSRGYDVGLRQEEPRPQGGGRPQVAGARQQVVLGNS